MTWHFKYGDKHHGDGVMTASIPHSGYFAELSQFLHPVLEFHFPKEGTGENTVERHYVREDIPQQYNSSNHRFFFENFMKTSVADRFKLGHCTKDHTCRAEEL